MKSKNNCVVDWLTHYCMHVTCSSLSLSLSLTHTHTHMPTECQTALIGTGVVSPQVTSNQLTVEKDALNMSRFLNRILCLPVGLQNQLFSYFTDTLAAVSQQAN